MSRRRTVLTLAFTLTCAGCAVGPNYRRPAPLKDAAQPFTGTSAAVDAGAQTPDAWWRLYQDPALDGFIEEALRTNADLASAEAHLGSARAILQQAAAGRYPSTDVALGAVYGRDANTDEILEISGHKPATTWLFNDILDVSYELDLFGHVRRSIEAAKADAQAAKAARDALRVTIAAETARAYASVCTIGEQIDVARRSVEVAAREARITTDRQKAGAGAQFDVDRSEVLVAQTQADVPTLEGERRAALLELTDLVGLPPSRAPASALSCRTAPHLAAPLPVGDGAGLLARRPDVREAERRLAASTARIGVATADLYPRISLTGLYGGAAADLAGLSADRGLTWGVGPSISWAFPIQAAPRARVREAKADTRAALAMFDGAVLRALKETEQALATYDADLTRRRSLDQAEGRADAAYRAADAQFRAGGASSLDLLVSEGQLIAVRAAVAASDSALAQDQIATFKALGGGWASAPTASRANAARETPQPATVAARAGRLTPPPEVSPMDFRP